MKRAPIKRRREGVRRGTVVDVEFREWVRDRGCAINRYGTSDEALRHNCYIESGYHANQNWPQIILQIHHVRQCGSPKSDLRILALCPGGHLHDFGQHSIERGKEQFEQHWGIDIESVVEQQQVSFEKEHECCPQD